MKTNLGLAAIVIALLGCSGNTPTGRPGLNLGEDAGTPVDVRSPGDDAGVSRDDGESDLGTANDAWVENCGDDPPTVYLENCLPGNYDVRVEIEGIQPQYSVGEEVKGRASMTNKGKEFSALTILTERIEGYDFSLTTIGAGNVPPGGSMSRSVRAFRSDGDVIVPEDSFSGPGTYLVRLDIYDCDCIQEAYGSCTGLDLPRGSFREFLENVSATIPLGSECRMIEVLK